VAVRSVLKGPAMLSFLSILAEVVLPRVKDFEGIHYVQNEKSGSINFGFPSSTMSLFPQIEGSALFLDGLIIIANFDSFSYLPGFDISIATTARSTADARLLLSAYGFPFKKGPRHAGKKPVGGLSALKKYQAKRHR